MVIRSAKKMAAVSRRLERRGKRIGVVPTMGALHEGHLSLIRAAKSQNDVVIVTIFVNPLQFGPQEDFKRYPRPILKDIRAARGAGADIIFNPSVKGLYPDGYQTSIELGKLSQRWDGASRPGHFRGVATAVALLFQLTRPTRAYFGQKDYQQARIIEQLIKDLHFPIRMMIMPIVRETDGLAMSSRNAYLTQSQRIDAAVLYQALMLAKERIHQGERRGEAVISAVQKQISEAASARIDYVAVADAKTLEPLWRLKGRVVVLLAVWIGATRLIDNLLVDVP